jgi:hypothetical protein
MVLFNIFLEHQAMSRTGGDGTGSKYHSAGSTTSVEGGGGSNLPVFSEDVVRKAFANKPPGTQHVWLTGEHAVYQVDRKGQTLGKV